MKLTKEQERKFSKMLSDYGKAYYDSHVALLSRDVMNYSMLLQKEVEVGKSIQNYVESL